MALPLVHVHENTIKNDNVKIISLKLLNELSWKLQVTRYKFSIQVTERIDPDGKTVALAFGSH